MIIEKSKLAHGLELARQIENLPLAVKSDLPELLLLDVQLLFSHRSPDCQRASLLFKLLNSFLKVEYLRTVRDCNTYLGPQILDQIVTTGTVTHATTRCF